MSVEHRLAQAALDRVRRRDPAQTQHPMTVGELQRISPAFDWKRYGEASEAPKFQALNVSVPEYVKAFNELIASTPVDDLKDYLRWHLINASAETLPKKIADADFDFFSRTLAGQPQPEPRWRRCVTQTDQRLGEALGKAFVDEAFGAQAKSDALKMVQDIKNAMRQDIDAAPWMSGETKKAAMVKLEAVVDRIGYPEKWRDYSAVQVARDDALGNMSRPRPKFEHAAAYELPNGHTLIGCYHPSRQNTNTGKLTPRMMDEVFGLAARHLHRPPRT